MPILYDPATQTAWAAFAAIMVVLFFWTRHALGESAKQEAARLAHYDYLDSIPFVVVSVNGETALVERYDGSRFDQTNAFPDLCEGDLCEIRRGTIIDYIELA